MRAVLTAVIAAIEAAAVAVAVFALIAVPSILVWWLVLDLGAEPAELAAIVLSIWQLSHFVPMQITLAPEAALSLGLSSEALSFSLSLAPLGLTLVTAALAVRSGWRFGGQGAAGAGAIVGGAVGFGAASTAAALNTTVFAILPLWGEVALPVMVYVLSIGLGFVVRSAREGAVWWGAASDWARHRIELITPAASNVSGWVAEAARLAAVGLLAVLALGAVGTAGALFFGYTEVIALNQSLHLNVLGVIMLFFAQLVLLPIAWIWGVAWFAGPGFSIGTATSVSPFDTLLGPLPSLPLLGAIPDSWGWLGGLAPMLVVALCAALGGAAGGRPALRQASHSASAAVALVAGVIVGLTTVVVTSLATGSIGPGRLELAGPAPWQVGFWVAVECAFGMGLGIFARKVDVERLRDMMPEALPSLVKSQTANDHVTSQLESSQPGEPRALGEPSELGSSWHQPGADEHADSSGNQGDTYGPGDRDESDEIDPLVRAFSWESGPQLGEVEPQHPSWRDRLRFNTDADTDRADEQANPKDDRANTEDL